MDVAKRRDGRIINWAVSGGLFIHGWERDYKSREKKGGREKKKRERKEEGGTPPPKNVERGIYECM